MKTISLLFVSLLSVSAHANLVPENWYLIPEDQLDTQKTSKMSIRSTSELSQSVDKIFQLGSEAIATGFKSSGFSILDSTPPPGYPKDWVPWHAEIFTTDLALSGRGLLGSLILRGTATVRAYWRKQYPTKKQMAEVHLRDELEEKPSLTMHENTSPHDIVDQLEPAIQAAVASGKIKDNHDLRQNLVQSAQDFRLIASNLSSNTSDLPWWVSRFRVDINIDASGNVIPIGTLGGEVRFRFEWHRIKQSHPKTFANSQNPEFQRKLQDFVNNVAYDLTEAFQETEEKGFQAHTMRMGIGVSAKGDIGLVKGSAGIVGQIYFTRNASRPKVNPKPGNGIMAKSITPLYLIEKNASTKHHQYAQMHKVHFVKQSDDTLFEIDRDVFRKGLTKAAGIGSFFAERAANANAGSWKVFELRVAFDSSLSGELDLVTLTGAVTAQIAFFNRNF
jgi:hypothetical protein